MRNPAGRVGVGLQMLRIYILQHKFRFYGNRFEIVTPELVICSFSFFSARSGGFRTK
ncbi:unnamed protein product [Amoebophrya sp. A120]|nr:unnamed protein product [Amoebophrya sp. A120]|eukprot:GSA120T00025868001.1